MCLCYQGQFEFPLKKFFWCLSNDFSFKEMPDLNDKHKEEDLKKFIDCEQNYFKGEPNLKLMAAKEGEEQE